MSQRIFILQTWHSRIKDTNYKKHTRTQGILFLWALPEEPARKEVQTTKYLRHINIRIVGKHLKI